MLPFSVTERARPGPSRRSKEISMITENALSAVVDLTRFPGTVIDVEILILQANASTRCAGINAGAMALAHAGIVMMAPDTGQMDVVDHLTNKPVPGETRNTLIESARIARGDISPIKISVQVIWMVLYFPAVQEL